MKNLSELKSSLMMCGTSVLAASALFVSACASVPVPTEQMADSRAAITEATTAGSSEYAPVQLSTAMEKMRRAEQAMTEEQYAQARSFAEQAQVDAQLALATTRADKAKKAADVLRADDSALREEMNRQTK